MPIASITSNNFSLPSAVKESRLRSAPVDVEERESRGAPSAPVGELSAAREDRQRVQPVVDVDTQNFQRIPSFEDLPTPQRLALETYLQTQQATLTEVSTSNDVIVGVDTFV